MPGSINGGLLTRTLGWYRCREGSAATHILKLGADPGEALADLVHTEAACLDLARRLDLTSVEAKIGPSSSDSPTSPAASRWT